MEALTPADIRQMPQNTGTLSVFTNERGGVIDDLVSQQWAERNKIRKQIITKIDGDALFLVTNAGRIDFDLAHLQVYSGNDRLLNFHKFVQKNAQEWRQKGKDVRVEVLEGRALIAVQGGIF